MREKQARVEFLRKEYRLLYNIVALDAIRNRYGSVAAMQEVAKENPEEFDRIDLPWIVALLINQSIDLDNFEHGTAKEHVDEGWIRDICQSPIVRDNFYQAIIEAIVLGNEGAPKEDPEAEVDEVLEELDRKEGIDRTIPPLKYVFWGMQCGLTQKEAWLTTPGRIWELWQYKLEHDSLLKLRRWTD
jgi:hypothetical protein